MRLRADVRVTARARAPLPAAAIARLAQGVLAAERRRVAALSITLLGPTAMRRLNREHLGHDRVTDVIAFSMTGAPTHRRTDAPRRGPVTGHRSPVTVGDVYICPSQAARQARELGIAPAEEFRRLVVHGVLHVLGYDHAAGPARTAGAMWRRQERHLARLAGRA